MMKLYSTACERNSGPIAEVLERVFQEPGLVLEIASGTGMHATFFASRFRHLQWQPTDTSDDALFSIDAWRADAELSNLRPPKRLDVTAREWPVAPDDLAVTGIFNANMVHISPWECAVGLFRGAGRYLAPGRPLVMYGPFLFGGRTAESNLRFDASLKSRDPSWGVRELLDLTAEANRSGLDHVETFPMPANNHILVFERRQPVHLNR